MLVSVLPDMLSEYSPCAVKSLEDKNNPGTWACRSSGGGVKPCRICGGQSGTGAGFLRVLRFPCQSFHRLLHAHHYPSSGTGTIDQIVADVPSGLSLTPPQETKQNNPGNCVLKHVRAHTRLYIYIYIYIYIHTHTHTHTHTYKQSTGLEIQ
jgi:hypothetical protein